MTANFDPDSLLYKDATSERRNLERDLALIGARANAFAEREGPCVGDFVIMPNGEKLRFTYDWGAELQTTSPSLSGDQSFCLGSDGLASFSGSLGPAIRRDKLIFTGEWELGWFWSFSNNERRAHNGVGYQCKCRVFKYCA
jgi:hypothetical protein